MLHVGPTRIMEWCIRLSASGTRNEQAGEPRRLGKVTVATALAGIVMGGKLCPLRTATPRYNGGATVVEQADDSARIHEDCDMRFSNLDIYYM